MLFEIRYRTRISGLAKIAYEDQYAYIEAANNREANKVFKSGIRFTRYGGKSVLRHELGTWYTAQPVAEADIKPERRWSTDFPRRPITVAQVAELFAQNDAEMANNFPENVRMTFEQYKAQFN